MYSLEISRSTQSNPILAPQQPPTPTPNALLKLFFSSGISPLLTPQHHLLVLTPTVTPENLGRHHSTAILTARTFPK